MFLGYVVPYKTSHFWSSGNGNVLKGGIIFNSFFNTLLFDIIYAQINQFEHIPLFSRDIQSLFLKFYQIIFQNL